MQIEVKGRNIPVTDELREHVEKRFAKVGKQVSELARLEVELTEERNPAIAGAAGRRGDALPQGRHAARARRVARPAPRDQPLRGGARRQVKRHRDKRRGRRKGATAESIRTTTAPSSRGHAGRILTASREARRPLREAAEAPRTRCYADLAWAFLTAR